MNRKLCCVVCLGLSGGLGAWLLTAGAGAESQQRTYVGAASCLCHADPVQKTWQQSKHAKAFELLKLAGEEENEKCLPCHTTGYGQGGYGSAETEANLEGVQCEACHGPASEHVTTAKKTGIQRTPAVAICARCHQDLDIHAVP